jgi:L-ascorbate peroxidase
MNAEAGLSWADSIAVAGAAAITACGGPDIRVRLGRTDSPSPDPQVPEPKPLNTKP